MLQNVVFQYTSDLFAENAVNDAMKHFGFSKLDIIASTFFIYCGLLSWILYFFAFKYQVEHLNMFCKGVEEFNKKNNKYNNQLVNTKGIKHCNFVLKTLKYLSLKNVKLCGKD